MLRRREVLRNGGALVAVGSGLVSGCLGASRVPNPSAQTPKLPDVNFLDIQNPPERSDDRVGVRVRNTSIAGAVQFRFYWADSDSEWVRDFSGNPERLVTEYGFTEGPVIEEVLRTDETKTIVTDRAPPADLRGTQVLSVPLLIRTTIKNVGFGGPVRVNLRESADAPAIDSTVVSMREDSTKVVSFTGPYEPLLRSSEVRVTAESAADET